jgi:signal transduction histidine kinase
MTLPLRVLLVEDSVDDAELISAALRRQLPEAVCERIETRERFEQALREHGCDIVISDFHLPRFGAIEALKLRAQAGADVPLVVVSGFVGEEAAVGVMKAGAADFVTKNKLGALPGIVRHCLREAQLARENRLAVQALAESEARLRELGEHLEHAREDERAAVAREIHDELGGILTAAKIELATQQRQLPPDRLDLLSTITSAEALVDQAMDMTRHIARRLRPAILDYGVLAAIDWQARDFAKRLGIDCVFTTEVEDVELEPEDATTVFRIFQEALTNVARHAQAKSVRVDLAVSGDAGMVLTVADDGRGCSSADLERRGSYGVRNMRERAQGLGGELRLQPGPLGGTEVILQVPLPRATGSSPVQARIPLEE